MTNVETRELTFMPDLSLNEDQWRYGEATAVGLLRHHGVGLQGLFPIPADALTPLPVTLRANPLKCVMLVGKLRRHRNALVWCPGFDTRIDETEWSLGG